MKEKSMGVPELSRAKMITLTLCFFLVFFCTRVWSKSVSLNMVAGQERR